VDFVDRDYQISNKWYENGMKFCGIKGPHSAPFLPTVFIPFFTKRCPREETGGKRCPRVTVFDQCLCGCARSCKLLWARKLSDLVEYESPLPHQHF
jgi:hypothetical protein